MPVSFRVASVQTSVSFWMLGIVEEMDQSLFLTIAIEMFSEFTTVIGLDSGGDKRGYSEKLLQEITAM